MESRQDGIGGAKVSDISCDYASNCSCCLLSDSICPLCQIFNSFAVVILVHEMVTEVLRLILLSLFVSAWPFFYGKPT